MCISLKIIIFYCQCFGKVKMTSFRILPDAVGEISLWYNVMLDLL